MDERDHAGQVITPIDSREIGAQPRRLKVWIVVGFFVAAIIAGIGGILIFRSVLPPSQQQRVITILPFMESFLPPRPGPNDAIPTPLPAQSNISPEDLLNAPIRLPTVEATSPDSGVGPSRTANPSSPARPRMTLTAGSS